MGNAISPCWNPSTGDMVKVVFWGGTVNLLPDTQLAGKLMFQYPDHIICHADSFYIGCRVPALAIDDELVSGETYFVLPLDRFPCSTVLSVASLSSLSNAPKGSPLNFGQCPFEYVKGEDGRTKIKVLPEFITRIISSGRTCGGGSDGGGLCSTPELQKHYNQLVGSREQAWSPKLETISECNKRLSPCRLRMFTNLPLQL